MNVLVRFASVFLAFGLTTPAVFASPLPAQKAVPMCAADQLSLDTDDENGSFNGMSHGGTLLVLRNLGTGACRLEAFPEITFNDGKGPVKITFTVPGAKFMHPGPVMVPAVLAPGAEATSPLCWVSGPVFDPGVCFNITSVAVRIGTGKQQTAFQAMICGPNATSVSVEKTRFNTDPVPKP